MRQLFFNDMFKISWLVFIPLLVIACDDTDTQSSKRGVVVENIDPTQDCRRVLPSQPTATDGRAVSTKDGKAMVTIDLENFELARDKEVTHFIHDRIFSEKSGLVGGFFYRGRVCVNGSVDCVDACVAYRLDPGQQNHQTQHRFSSKLSDDNITLEYWFVDDNDYLSHLKYEIKIKDDEVKSVKLVNQK